MATASNRLLGPLLKEVSRSFYLTLRVLPARIHPQIGLAYLLARTTDTIADTNLASVELRLEALRALRDRILGTRQDKFDFGPLSAQQTTPAEKILLEEHEASLQLLDRLQPADCDRVRQVLRIIISGQELDLQRFARGSVDRVIALQTEEELNDYTYRVAGCVGEFWTRICRAHLFPAARLDENFLLAQGVRFGKGLQLVNILRDMSADLRLGRCYLPEQKLSTASLTPRDLLEAANEPRLRPLYDEYLGKAQENLMAGWAYTNALPFRSARVRLACAWPVLIGLDTIQRLRRGNVLDPQKRIKISRGEVKKWIARSVIYYVWPSRWRGLAEEAADIQTADSKLQRSAKLEAPK